MEARHIGRVSLLLPGTVMLRSPGVARLVIWAAGSGGTSADRRCSCVGSWPVARRKLAQWRRSVERPGGSRVEKSRRPVLPLERGGGKEGDGDQSDGSIFGPAG